jgi:hypothetical protein
MNERMYWGLLGLVFFWLLVTTIRLYVLLRMKVEARDLLHKERVAAIANARTDLPPPDPEFASEFPLLPFIKHYGGRNFLLLSGITLTIGGLGVWLALHFSNLTALSNWVSIAWIPGLLGLGLIVSYLFTRE